MVDHSEIARWVPGNHDYLNGDLERRGCKGLPEEDAYWRMEGDEVRSWILSAVAGLASDFISLKPCSYSGDAILK